MKTTGLSHRFLGLYCVSGIKTGDIFTKTTLFLLLVLFYFNEKQKHSQNTPGSGMNMKLAGRPSV